MTIARIWRQTDPMLSCLAVAHKIAENSYAQLIFWVISITRLQCTSAERSPFEAGGGGGATRNTIHLIPLVSTGIPNYTGHE